MVMYEDNGAGVLTLSYSYSPTVKEVINDIFDAPIENGDNFQTRKSKKAKKIPIDNFLYVVIDGTLSDDGVKEICETMTSKLGWRLAPFTIDNKVCIGFEIVREFPIDEQKKSMEAKFYGGKGEQ